MKKRMRLLSVLLCVAMVAGLSACGSKKEDKGEAKNDGKIKLTFSTSVYVEEPHQKAIDALLEAYNKKNPDVEIEILGAGYDGYWDNITTEILANNESDMIQVYPENISTYHAIREDGTFIDLSDYMSDELKGKLVGQDMCDVNGETLAISSYAWGTTGIFYRKSMLEDAGVDPESIKTQEDFREACAKFTKDGKYAMGVVSGTHAFTVSEWSRLIARPVSGGLYFPVYPENISTYHAIREDGTFIDLSDYMSDELKGKLVGQDMCDVNGETLAISSYAWGTTGIFYRKSMLEDAGVDPESIKTQEDFREACAKFTKDGKYAMGVVSGTHAFTVSEWSRLIARPVSGGLYFPNGESEPYTADNVNVNAPENVWAAQWWQDFILKDKAAKLVTDKKDSREMFWNGEVPFNMDGPWFVGMSKERDESLMDDIGIIPQFDVTYEGETYKPNPTNYPLVTMISKNCEHPDEAYAFLEWMTTDEAQALIADCGMIPSNTDYSTSDEYIKNHELEYAIVGFMQNNYAELIADPNIAQLGEISQVMLDAAQKMFSEQAADVQTEMDNAQKQIEEVMSRQE